ncbi:MAG: WG repeat-containing protein [Saprospiraceae bacterium]|nr:WG repeat-containing protein [Saprospiraceae bacterium]
MTNKSKFFIGFLLVWVLGFNAQAQQTFVQYNYEGEIITATSSEKAITNSGARIVSSYQEGLAVTQLGNKYGFVNKLGHEICLPKYDQIRLFKNGYASAKLNGQWSFINKQGKKITSFRFDWVGSFQNGAAPVQVAGKWGLINEQGINILAAEYDEAYSFDSNGIAKVRKGDQWFSVNEAGEKMPIIKDDVKSVSASL